MLSLNREDILRGYSVHACYLPICSTTQHCVLFFLYPVIIRQYFLINMHINPYFPPLVKQISFFMYLTSSTVSQLIFLRNWAERAKLNRKWRLWQVPVGLILMSFSSFFLVYAKWALQRRYRDSSAWTMNAQFRYTSAGIAHYDPSISSYPLHHDHPPSAYHEPPSQLRLVSRNIAMARSRHDANRLR